MVSLSYLYIFIFFTSELNDDLFFYGHNILLSKIDGYTKEHSARQLKNLKVSRTNQIC